MIATNFSGPRRYGYGTIRDYVIGISAVDGRGTAFKAGGRVVKNVAGYDFCKLLTGSLGTLAVITQVTLKVRPVAERSAFVVANVVDLNEAEMLLSQLVHSATTPVAIELLYGPAWDDLLPARHGKLQVVLGLEGTAPEVDWMLGQLAGEWRSLGVDSQPITEPDQVAAIWSVLVEFPANPGAALVVKANLVPSATTRFVDEIVEIDPDASIQAHAGDGIVIARFGELPKIGLAGAMVKRLQPAARRAQGTAIVLRAAQGGELTHPVVWGPSPTDLGLMRAVKNQFDPRGILNPGRFLY